jgi:hypothetical protein
VNTCLNPFSEGALGDGKSPCFLGMCFRWVLDPDWLVYNLIVDNGAENFG